MPTKCECPCCGDLMAAKLITCWTCYHLTEGLHAGWHYDTTLASAPLFELKRSDVAAWSEQAVCRVMDGDI